MMNLPISDYIKEYYKEHDFVFDDFTRATIIWHSYLCWHERLSMLKEIADKTTDEALKLQIKERVEFELQEQMKFMDNKEKKYIYQVVKYEDGSGISFFTTAESAIEFGKKYCEDEIRIHKFPINPIDDKNGSKIGTCVWDKSGTNILEFISLEYGYFDVLEETYGRKERFEDAFIRCEYPFERGDIVRDVSTGEIGVLESSREDWDSLIRRVDAGELNADASDIIVSVDYVGDDGKIYYNHIVIFDLEKVTEFESKEQEDLMRSISALLQGKEMLWGYTYYLQQYVNSR